MLVDESLDILKAGDDSFLLRRASSLLLGNIEFRQPFARVRSGADHLYVDKEGFCLPAGLVPMYVLSLQDNQTRAVRQVCYQALGEVPEAWRSAAKSMRGMME